MDVPDGTPIFYCQCGHVYWRKCTHGQLRKQYIEVMPYPRNRIFFDSEHRASRKIWCPDCGLANIEPDIDELISKVQQLSTNSNKKV